jgi:hypothetical protein
MLSMRETEIINAGSGTFDNLREGLNYAKKTSITEKFL